MIQIKNPTTENFHVVPETTIDKRDFTRALGAAQVEFAKVMAVNRGEVLSPLRADISEDIMRGLANISLGVYGERGFSGLTQEQADQQLCALSGDVEDFFKPILEAKT